METKTSKATLECAERKEDPILVIFIEPRRTPSMIRSAKNSLILLSVSALLYASPSFAGPQAQQQDFATASKVLFQQHNWKALEDLARADVLANPKKANGWEILGVSLGCQNRLPEAQGAFERAYSIEPGKASNCINLAVIYAKNSSRTELDKLMKDLKARTREDVALRALDREEVFQALAPSGAVPIAQSRRATAIYPEPKNYPAGPARELIFGRYPGDSVNGGLALFELYVAPDGSVQAVQFLAGNMVYPHRADPMLKLIKFSALPPAEGMAIQRAKIVLRIAVREGRVADGEKSGLINRVGIGASLAEAERNTVDIK